MSGTPRLLARIKALFEPSRPPAPPPEVEEAPTRPAVPEIEEAHPAEPITIVEEPSPAETVQVSVAEAPPVTAGPPAAIQPLVPAAGALTLRLETERGIRSTFEITKSGATIGRGPESTIQLADLSVSRKHARITYKQGAFWLSDLGSMGGTWIDGTKLAAPRRVATGQTIDIGVCRLTVVSAGADEDPAARGPSQAALRSGR